ncbi:SRPBCC family protein [Cohnella silvisoli]|uniref:SRPBCC family protein n=1 Tax=Cohnella silvisoli TaxID=2873699 RepID=A0ABV1KZ21_9BACL|nr:SRPBCC family protein [Cohnella silvisoli]MCD9021878.1 SRPBCC family protein [Cohnella silvisoli]
MNEHSVKHDTFFIERSYNASPARVFAAWADPAIKANWFPKAEEFDFHVGGREIIRMSSPEGTIYTSAANYQEIVPDKRIVYTLYIDMGETRISVAVITVEFKFEGAGTQLIYTEQCAFLDGLDSLEDHMHGANDFLDKLDIELKRAN